MSNSFNCLWGFYLVPSSGTYSSSILFCLASCVCGLCSAGYRIVVPHASGLCSRPFVASSLSLGVDYLFDSLQSFLSMVVQQVVVICGVFVRGDELKSFYSAMLCLTWGERLTSLLLSDSWCWVALFPWKIWSVFGAAVSAMQCSGCPVRHWELSLDSGRDPPPNSSAEHSLFAGSSVWGSVESGGRNMSTKDLNTEQDGLEASQALPLGRTEETWLILVGVERGRLP